VAEDPEGPPRSGTTVHVGVVHVAHGGTAINVPGVPAAGVSGGAADLERRNVQDRELARLLSRFERLSNSGQPTSEVRQAILDLKRERLVPGSPLQAGDALGNGRYALERQLGHGGIGTVWLARETLESDRYVAVKVLHGHFAQDATMVERFARGARQMAKLDRAGAVEVLDQASREDGWPYYVMEYVEGGDLYRALLEGQITPTAALEVVCRVAEALDDAHGKEIVHRDVSPQNILLSLRGPLISDFDLVRAADTTAATRTGALGRMPYAAPEALDRPQDADHRADIYSLGMTALCCAAAGKIPGTVAYNASGFLRGLGLGKPLTRAIDTAIQREPGARYADMRAFRAALSAALSERAVMSGDSTIRVLVVDDEEVIREILADFLSMDGFWARTAHDGADALRELRNRSFDVVLADLKMPNMGGIELLKILRDEQPELPCIMMTGFGTVETAVAAMKLGARDYILKPFKVEDVVVAIKRVTGGTDVSTTKVI
jgi:CheY-like chemotaxis protein